MGSTMHRSTGNIHANVLGRQGAAIALVACTLAGCETKKLSDVDGYHPPPLAVVLTNPGEEPQCACSNSAGAYLANSDSKDHVASWSIYTKDTFANTVLQPISGSGAVPAKGRRFLGCTLHAPGTSCRFQANYYMNSYSLLRVSTAGASTAAGATGSPSVAACTASCSDPGNPTSLSCLTLGVRYYRAVAPLDDLVASSGSSGTVKKADLLSKYHMTEADDPCRRGDIIVKDGVISNSGKGEACVVKSEDLPTQVAKALGISRGSPQLELRTVVPETLTGQRSANLKRLSATDVVEFREVSKGPYVIFDGPGADRINAQFGGPVLGVAAVSPPGQAKRSVVATSSGCISVLRP